MIYEFFFIKCVFRWSENSVRFENHRNQLSEGPNSVRFGLTVVRYGMYTNGIFHKATHNKVRMAIISKIYFIS